MRNSKSCGHPIIGTGGCCIRCGTRKYKSRISLRRVQLQVLERVTAQLKASMEPVTIDNYSMIERMAREASKHKWTGVKLDSWPNGSYHRVTVVRR